MLRLLFKKYQNNDGMFWLFLYILLLFSQRKIVEETETISYWVDGRQYSVRVSIVLLKKRIQKYGLT